MSAAEVGSAAVSVAEVVQRLLVVDDAPERRAVLDTALAALDVEELLVAFKAEAERQWTISPHASLRMAEALILGASLADRPTHHALGLMAKADALRYLGRYPESLEYFESSAQEFLALGDEVGWARTRIGWIHSMHSIGRGEAALPVAQQAHDVLLRYGELVRAAGLAQNEAVVHFRLGNYTTAVEAYDRA